MEKQETTLTNVSMVNPEGLDFEKVDVQILKVPKAGDFFIGKFVEQSVRPWKNDEGEDDTIDQLHFTDLNGKNPFVVFADGGLLNAFMTANIKAGDIMKAVKGEKAPLKGGRTVNQWTIYKAKTTAH